MKPRPHLEAELLDRVADGAGAADRPRRAVERREDLVLLGLEKRADPDLARSRNDHWTIGQRVRRDWRQQHRVDGGVVGAERLADPAALLGVEHDAGRA